MRAIGSGNIGATNVLRTGRKDLAAGTLLLDALKATAAVLMVARLLAGHRRSGGFRRVPRPYFSGMAQVQGRQGRGDLPRLSARLFLAGRPGLRRTLAAVAFLCRYSSLSALLASAASPFVCWGLGRIDLAVATAIMAAILWSRHRENIARLRAGTEGKIGKKP